MSKRTTAVRLLALAVGLTVGVAFGWPIAESQAQETRTTRIKPGTLNTYRVPSPGGYSMTLSDIWGLPEMPPAPRDFGPHFDFPAGGNISLQGPPDHSPYPN